MAQRLNIRELSDPYDTVMHVTRHGARQIADLEIDQARLTLTAPPGSGFWKRLRYGIHRFLNGFRRTWINMKADAVPEEGLYFLTDKDYDNWRKSMMAYRGTGLRS